MKTGAEAVIDTLIQNKITTVFGYPGATCAPLYQALSKSSIRHILTRTEQAAAHSAGAYARVHGGAGVCIATSGPGATNLITGIANAYMDSVPLVAITGQVSSESIGQDVFQEADITGATAPFCKHNFLVTDVDEIEKTVNDAIYIASTGRPGPVLIDLPVDIQLDKCTTHGNLKPLIKGYKPTYRGNGNQIKRAATMLRGAKRPLIIAGGGVIISGAKSHLRHFAEKLDAPVVSTLMGTNALETEHELNCSMIGIHGAPQSNFALNHADVIVILGARAADRSINRDAVKNAAVIHVDIDPAEIGKVIGADIPIVGDLSDVIPRLTERIDPGSHRPWLNEIKSAADTYETKPYGFDPRDAIRLISEAAKSDAVITTEVGQNQIWTVRNWNFHENTTFLTSGGLGAMGYGLAAAVGAKIAGANQVIAIEGDGSMQMSLAELATISENNLDIKIVLMRNGCLGMINEMQKQLNYNRFSIELGNVPKYEYIAKAYGIKYEKADTLHGLEEKIAKMMSSNGAFLLELVIDPEQPSI